MSDSDYEPRRAPQNRRSESRPQRRGRRPPPVVKPKHTFTTDPNKVPKHLRLRYWNSWEEMKLIELWRLYCDEVTTLQKNIPIFRTIYDGMRDYGFHVNSQECRRKISSMKNKYIADHRRIDSGDIKMSELRYYPLIRCLLVPKQKEPKRNHQQIILKQLFSKIQPEEVAQYMIPTVPEIKVEHKVRRRIKAENNVPNKVDVECKPLSNVKGDPNLVNDLLQISEINTSVLSIPGQSLAQDITYPCLPQIEVSCPALKNRFTEEGLAQLRVSNKLLSDQRDVAAQKLSNEEQKLKLMELLLIKWVHIQERLLGKLQCAEGDAIS